MYQTFDELALISKFIASHMVRQVLYALLIYFRCLAQTVMGMTSSFIWEFWPLSTSSILVIALITYVGYCSQKVMFESYSQSFPFGL